MRTVPAVDIIVAKFRHRKLFNDRALDELADSMASHGLLHPIVCVIIPNGKLRLVAGGRRLRAAHLLEADSRTFMCDDEAVPLGHIPYVLISDHEAIRIREAELEENIQREDLTWQERTTALDELHRLRTAANPAQTISDTARELESSTGARGGSHYTAKREVSRATILAPHLDDPDVAGARSASAAFAIVSRKVESEFREELERRGKAKRTIHTLVVGDLKAELPKLPADTFTCIIADPPYGIGADKFGDNALLPHHYEDTQSQALDIAGYIMEEGLRITKSEAHLYMFCDIELFVPLRDAINTIEGWDVWRTPIIWHKGVGGYAPSGVAGLRRSYELILWARRGGKSFGQVWSDVIETPTVSKKIHAAEKPVGLYRTLLRRSCLPGDRVLDPCCGSGTIFPAATLAHCTATGIENDKEAAKLARTRLEE